MRISLETVELTDLQRRLISDYYGLAVKLAPREACRKYMAEYGWDGLKTLEEYEERVEKAKQQWEPWPLSPEGTGPA